ncbi:MAG TPA: PQQ-dependent sugar dehydrogenase [Phycisphaerae bacterium]|nr:PQQ-dependent sugar dehydrogenase [Phycisphaerae bacterium]
MSSHRLAHLTLAKAGFLPLFAIASVGATCNELVPSDGGKPAPQVVKTDVGTFYRKVILLGGSAGLESFTQPAALGFGPDGRLYVTTYTGSLFALTLDEQHEVTGIDEYKPFGDRLLNGFAFGPAAPPNDPVLYVAHNAPPIYNAPPDTGAISRIRGLGTGPVEHIVAGLPRSAENHMTFTLAFGPDGRLYIAQGGNTNNGAPAPGLFGNRSETPLSAAILVANVHDPAFAGLDDLEVYAPGLRNAYGMCWHSNGLLYALDQGANKGFGGPPAPDGSTLPDVASRDDVLHAILPDSYYGHPNPARNQYAYFTSLPDGTPYRDPIKAFTAGAVVTGVAEYDSSANDGKLQGQLLVTGFVDQNLYRIALSADGLTVVDENILDAGFDNPIAVTVGPDGAIYVLEAGNTLAFGGSGPAGITVLEPLGSSAAIGKIDLFATSAVCAACHTDLTDGAGNDVSIDRHWRSTMMANAARDPYFVAKVSAEVALFPAQQADIEAKCATCHTGMARTQALANGEPVALLGNGMLDPAHPLHELAMDGVSCTLCHQIQNVGLGSAATFSGGYKIDTTTAPPDRLIFGPFFNPQTDLMQAASGFKPARGAHITESSLCASCHTLMTTCLDDQGHPAGEFPEQTPFLEWLHSDFGRGAGPTCQGCHMPEADGSVVISALPEKGLPAHAPFRQHHFVGGNTFMLQLMRQNAAALGIVASDAELAATFERTLEQLQSRSADVSIAAAVVSEGVLSADVQVVNRAGHKLPTGYPARRAWLHMTVTDATGRVIFESGAADPRGAIIGDDANADPLAFEPHYDTINSADQVQIYQAVMADHRGTVTHSLMRACAYLSDNRLLPAGFDKQSAPAEISVVGPAQADGDFTGGADRVRYEVAVAGATGPFTVRVELLYQSVPPVVIDDLRTIQTPEIARFVAMFDAADPTPVVLAAATAVAE